LYDSHYLQRITSQNPRSSSPWRAQLKAAESSISNWSCKVCGKVNTEKNGKTQRLCLTCGRPKGYVGSKKIQVLNNNRIDITPHLNCATKDELKKTAMIAEVSTPMGYEGNKNDYETNARTKIKDEVNNVIESIRSLSSPSSIKLK
jgi:hypothetical protein